MKNNLFSNPNAFLLKKKITHLEKEIFELKNEYNDEVSSLIKINGKKQTLVGKDSIGKQFRGRNYIVTPIPVIIVSEE